VEHLLDHAERREPSGNYSSKTVFEENHISIASERLGPAGPRDDAPDTSKCNVGLVTEEVVETMIIGQAPFNATLDATLDANISHDGSVEVSRQSIATRRSRFVILDIGDYEALGFRLSANSFSRILMRYVSSYTIVTPLLICSQ
jgi:hypothetical protein